MYCIKCSSRNHTYANCPKTDIGLMHRRTSILCPFCGKKGHTIDTCPSTVQGQLNRRVYEYSDEFYKD